MAQFGKAMLLGNSTSFDVFFVFVGEANFGGKQQVGLVFGKRRSNCGCLQRSALKDMGMSTLLRWLGTVNGQKRELAEVG